MPNITTKFIDGSTDLGGKGLVAREYIMDVYPNLAPGVKTPALWTWGSNAYGRLGSNSTIDRSSPVQTITSGTNWKQVSCGLYAAAAVKTDGTLWLWGYNAYGKLGDNTVTNRSSPVQTIVGGTNWKQVSCGSDHTACIKADGTLWTWGFNNTGQLGDNTATNRSSPIQTVTGETNWKQVACGFDSSAAVKTDGTLWLWGYNAYGKLGDNTATNRLSPVQTITGGNNWVQVACGQHHTAAVKTDGTLWLWGSNGSGQLGDNTVTNRSSPVQTITGGTNWKQVACGYAHTAAIKTDGTLWTWGLNIRGQLGNNTTTGRSSPVQTITGGTNWKQVDCAKRTLFSSATAAVKTDGTLWTWGGNGSGQLGDNTVTNRSSPVQTIMRGATWKQVACGYQYMAAIADGNY